MQINKSLLTGASGFLGEIIYSKLMEYGTVISISRKGGSISLDLANYVPDVPEIDLVVHCAGKAHMVPKNETDERAFFAVNVRGTQNLLKGLEAAPKLPKSFIFISSVAVYGLGSGILIDESTSLNAKDPYGRSKVEAEKIILDWCTEKKVICGILRLPLIVGINPPGNLGAMIRGVKGGYYFNIAGGTARKSMVMASDIAAIIKKLAEVGGVYNLTDGDHPSFSELSHRIAFQVNRKNILNIPNWLAKFVALLGDGFRQLPINSNKLTKITTDLTFDDSKARRELGWDPSKVLDHFFIK